MQHQSFFIGLGLTTLIPLVSLTVSIPPTLSQSTASQSQSGNVTFFCRQIVDRASGEKIPTTVVWVPELKSHRHFIGWKSEYFSNKGWTPEERCQKVTQKLQAFYEQGRLNYFSYNNVNGYPVICGLVNQGETCNSNNQLFTIKSNSDPAQVLHRLMDLAEGKTSEPLLQNSGNQVYISVKDFLKRSRAIDIKS